MTRNDFFEAIKRKAELADETGAYVLSRKSIDLAIDLLEVSEGELGKRHIGDALQFACRIENHMGYREKNSKETGDYNSFIQRVTQQDIVGSDYLVEQITPSVNHVREMLFGDCEPPFDSIAAAVSWIRKKAAEPLSADIKTKKERGVKEYQRLRGLVISGEAIGLFGVSRNYLDFPGEDGFISSVPVVQQTDLAILASHAKRISEATGFRKYAATVYILTGLKPILPRVNTSVRPSWHELPAGNHLWRKNIVIEINAADLTFNELKAIYDNYRKDLGIVKKKPLNVQQARLYNLVVNKGGPPAKGATAFWRAIQKEWNSDTSNSSYQTWEGVYQRYKTIEDKLKNLYNEAPDQYAPKQ
ncbi:MAG: hypothetical protein GX883_05740 [Firmicutes bacterium]|nr:hypothetical protein [Bacillota bacterium]